MKKIPAFLFLFFTIALQTFSQRTIKGKIIDEVTQQPIAGGSVFISNTSIGTVANRDGDFEINDIPPGKYDLVISSVGYQTNVMDFTTDDLPLKLLVKMTIKVRELDNVTVEPSVEEGWDKWGKTFTDNFIGKTANAAKCRIKNFKSIRFRFFKKSNRLIAYCDEALVLENKALGYRIKYQLEEFEIKFREQTSVFAGYPLFEELDKTPRSKIINARDEAYYGSMTQFFRCVYNNNLAENGFEVRRMFRRPNLEKERIKSFYRPKRLTIGIGSNSSVQVPDNTPNEPTDSSSYYERILRQKDYIDTYGFNTLTGDSLVVGTEGAVKAVYFTDYLYITYKLETEDPLYLQQFRESRKPSFQSSHVWLQTDTPLLIDRNGSYFPPQNLFTMSYWGWNEKLANMLPLDYIPVHK